MLETRVRFQANSSNYFFMQFTLAELPFTLQFSEVVFFSLDKSDWKSNTNHQMSSEVSWCCFNSKRKENLLFSNWNDTKNLWLIFGFYVPAYPMKRTLVWKIKKFLQVLKSKKYTILFVQTNLKYHLYLKYHVSKMWGQLWFVN